VTDVPRLERAFLGERVTGQGGTLGTLGDLYPDGGGVGSGNSSGAEHGVLRKNFVVNLGNEVILAVGIAAPHLPELDGTDCHRFVLTLAEVLPDYREARKSSIPGKVTEGHIKHCRWLW
jgi:hypothetical protein